MNNIDRTILSLAEQLGLNPDAADTEYEEVSDGEAEPEPAPPKKTRARKTVTVAPETTPKSTTVVTPEVPILQTVELTKEDKKKRRERIYYLGKTKGMALEEATAAVDDPDRKIIRRTTKPKEPKQPKEPKAEPKAEVKEVVQEIKVEAPKVELKVETPKVETIPEDLQPPKLIRQKGYYVNPLFAMSCR